jgi:hypothetical protein
MKGRMYSRGEKKLEKNGKDRKEADIVKNEDLTPFFAPFGLSHSAVSSGPNCSEANTAGSICNDAIGPSEHLYN